MIDTSHYLPIAITALTLSTLLPASGFSDDTPQLPKTPLIPATETYHGVEVIENYQWLENGNDPRVIQWSKEQNEYTRWILDNIPVRKAIAERLHELYNKASPQYHRFQYQNGMLFALKDQPPLDQPLLVKLDSPHDLSTEQVVLDPNKLDPTGLTSIDFFVVSSDARLVAVSLSKGGTEDGDVHIYEVATGTKLPDTIPRVNGPTAGGDVAWTADNSGFYYTRYPRESERPPEDMRFYQQIYFHKLGTPTTEDTYALGKISRVLQRSNSKHRPTQPTFLRSFLTAMEVSMLTFCLVLQ